MDGELTAYQAALDFLFVRTAGATRFGLARTSALLAALGDPQRAFPALHVAGTNGKGSTCATLEALLRDRGLRVGRYTSPHLVDFRERILVDGVPPSTDAVTHWVARHGRTCERLEATFFEATTAMALDLLAEARVDVAVIEVGLGGRLDATNVIVPLVAGVTSIGLDHVDLLGATVEQVAAEKAGIFKPGVPAVIGPVSPPVRAVLLAEARRHGASCTVDTVDAYPVTDVALTAAGTHFTMARGGERAALTTPLVGRYQASNTAVAVAMLDAAGPAYAVRGLGDLAAPLARVGLPGRFDRRGRWLFDVAHNPDGAAVLASTLEQVQTARPLTALLTVLADKDWRGIMRALAPVVDRFVLTRAPTAPAARAWRVEDAAAFAAAEGWVATLEPDFDAALVTAAAGAATVLVTGSFHTVGDAMVRLQMNPLSR